MESKGRRGKGLNTETSDNEEARALLVWNRRFRPSASIETKPLVSCAWSTVGRFLFVSSVKVPTHHSAPLHNCRWGAPHNPPSKANVTWTPRAHCAP